MSNDNTSATGRFLIPSPSPSHQKINVVLHDFIGGVTGLMGDLVRPRWQPMPPKQPAHDVNWCAFGIVDRDPRGSQLVHLDDVAQVRAEKQITVLTTFYGPDADDIAESLWQALQISQNRDFLLRHDLALITTGMMINVPEQVHEQWLWRTDLPLILRHGTQTNVSIDNIREVPMRGVINASGQPVTGGIIVQR